VEVDRVDSMDPTGVLDSLVAIYAASRTQITEDICRQMEMEVRDNSELSFFNLNLNFQASI